MIATPNYCESHRITCQQLRPFNEEPDYWAQEVTGIAIWLTDRVEGILHHDEVLCPHRIVLSERRSGRSLMSCDSIETPDPEVMLAAEVVSRIQKAGEDRVLALIEECITKVDPQKLPLRLGAWDGNKPHKKVEK